MPKKREVATLIVGNFVFRDWESVWVQHRLAMRGLLPVHQR